ncbi:MAG: M48 family metalloprotease [Acidobacteria bacterium]|nr:M48 family metalloprotease [Acidobacteriota bacterium]
MSAPPAIEAGQSVYESLPLKKREWQLIEAAQLFEVQAEARGDIYRHPALNELIRRIGSQLAPPPTDTYLKYRFHILRSPHPGAFALPDGQVYVNLGMLAILENEAQLATLLAHEIHHAAGHHSIRHFRNSRRRGKVGLVFGVVAASAFVLLGGDPTPFFEPSTKTSVEAAVPKPAVLGYKRRREKEADERASRILAKVGYDVRKALRLYEILGRVSEGGRVAVETKWTKNAQLQTRANSMRRMASDLGSGGTLEVGAESYGELRWRASLDTVHEYIRAGYFPSAASAAERLVEERDGDPEAHFALAEAYLALGDQQEDGFRDALEEYTRTLSLDSDFAQAHRGMGLALLRMGSFEEAARELQTYLQARPLAPDRPLVLHRLEKIETELGKEGTEDPTPRLGSVGVSVPPIARQDVRVGKKGRPSLPGPDPMSASLGLTVEQRNILPVGSRPQASRVFFVKLEDGEETLGERAFAATDLIPSDYSHKKQVFLLNAEPGRYVAVAAVLTSLNSSSSRTAFFSMAMIAETEVTVGPQEMAFMGEYSVSTSRKMKMADQAQAHYYRVLLPGAAERGFHARIYHRQQGYTADLKSFAKDAATERGFWTKAHDEAFERDPRWQARARRQLAALSSTTGRQ